jgi:ribosomal protein S1
MSARPIASPSDIVNVGDELTLMVIRVDPNERRIGLSLKELAQIVEEPMPSESRGRKGRKRRSSDDDFDDED